MASRINRSFLWGVAIASLTWILSLWFFWHLSSSDVSSGTAQIVAQPYHYEPQRRQPPLPHLNGLERSDKSFLFFDKFREQTKKNGKSIREELMEDLEPVDLPRGNGK